MKKADEIRLVSVEGENVRTLKTIAVRLDGESGLFRVTGENEQGKTTFLDVIAMLFGGKKAVKPDTIQEGKDSAWCRATLTNGYSIERRFTPAAPDGYLDVLTPDEARPKAPQTILDGWCGSHSWDPGALLRKRTSEIETIILGLAKDPGLKEKRAAISEQRDRIIEDRRPWNAQKQRAERTKRPDGERPEPVDISGEMEKLGRLQAVWAQRVSMQTEAKELRQMADRSAQTLKAFDSRIEELKKRLEAAEKERAAEANLLTQTSASADEADAELEKMPDPSNDIAAVEARIKEADAVNDALEPWRAFDRAQTEIKEAAGISRKLTQKIKDLDAEEEELLKAAEIPVRGISFAADGSMLLDGHPLEVASGMRRLDMSVDIAFAANPQVRICLLDEANDYGLPALEALHQRAIKDGFQVLACRIGLEGPGEILVGDGAARSAGEKTEG